MELPHSARDAVVLVHGLWLNGLELAYIARQLKRSGYAPHRFHYGSVSQTVEHNAAELARFCRSLSAPRIHLVGHSLGGLVILRMLADRPEAQLGRTVFIATPFRGSSAARSFNRYRIGHWMLGRSVQGGLLGEDIEVPSGLELGVIAGTRGFGLGRLLAELKPPHDGTVSLEETRLEGAEQITLPLTHTTLLFSKRTAEAVREFLRSGTFGGRPQTATAVS